jgi:hypothetical protein
MVVFKGADVVTGLLGLGSIGTSIFGGQSAAQAQADALRAQVEGANFSAQLQTNAAANKRAQELLGMQFGEFVAAPRELERQKEAQKFQFGELGALQRAGRQEDMRRQASFATSALGRDTARQAAMFQERLERAKARGAYSGLFGPIASDFT